MAESIHEVLWVAAPESRRIRYVNRAYESVWGRRRPAEGSEAPTWPEAVHPDDLERVVKALQCKEPPDRYEEVYRIVRPDRAERWIWDRAVVVRDTAGRVRHLAGIAADVTDRKKAEEALTRSRARLRALTARLQAIREEERTRVAREIHDELGQALTSLKLDLAWLADDTASDRRLVRRRLRSIAKRVDGALETVRTIATSLRPAPLDDLGLAAAVEWHAGRFRASSGVSVSLDVAVRESDLDPDVSTAVFRILQEALTNVARHAKASRVEVRLSDDAGVLRLEVVDDGRGITDSERDGPGSLGILGMRERALGLRGDLDVGPLSAGGTALRLRIPLRRREGTP